MASEIALRFRVEDDGTLVLLDQADQKLRTIAKSADELGARGGQGFSKLGADVVTANAAFELIGKTIGAAVTGAVNALGFVISEGGKFQSAMTEATARAGDLSAAMRDDLAEAAKSLGPAFAFAGAEGAKGIQALLSAGLSAEDALAALPVAAAHARAGMQGLSEATEQLTAVQASLGQRIAGDAVGNMENLAHISDVLTEASIRSRTEIDKLAESLTDKGGTALRAFNKDITEGLAALSAFAERGITGSQAGTALYTVLTELARVSDKNADAFKKAGIAVYDNTGTYRNLADIVEDVEKALAGLSDEHQRAQLAELGFSKGAAASMLALVGLSDELREYEDALNSAGGATARVADEQMKSFELQLKATGDMLRNVAATIFSELEPALVAAMEAFRSLLQNDALMAAFAGALSSAVGAVQSLIDIVNDLDLAFRKGAAGAQFFWAAASFEFQDAKDALAEYNRLVDETTQRREQRTTGRADAADAAELERLTRGRGESPADLASPVLGVLPTGTAPPPTGARRPPVTRTFTPLPDDDDDAKKAAKQIKDYSDARAQVLAYHAEQVDLAEATAAANERSAEQAEFELALAKERGVAHEHLLALAEREDELQIKALESQRALLDAEIARNKEKGESTRTLEGEQAAIDQQIENIQRFGDATRDVLADVKREVFDLTDALAEGIPRALDALASRDSGKKFSDLFQDLGRNLVGDLVSAFLKAELAKNKFDVKITENFTVTLPGVFKSAANIIGNIWAKLFGDMAAASDDATSDIAGSVNDVADAVGSIRAGGAGGGGTTGGGFDLLSLLGGAGGLFGGTAAAGGSLSAAGGFSTISGTGGVTSGGLMGGAVSGPASGVTAFEGGAGISGGGSGATGGGGMAGAGFALAGIMATASALEAGTRRFDEIKYKLMKSEDFTADLYKTALTASFQGFGLPEPLAKVMGKLFSAGPDWLDNLLNPLGGSAIMSALGLFQQPAGTAVAMNLVELLNKGGLPQAMFAGHGVTTGVRTPGFAVPLTQAELDRMTLLGLLSGSGGSQLMGQFNPQLAALVQQQGQPGVGEQRTGGALALGQILFGQTGQGGLATFAAANELTNNLLALGVSAEEARRQLQLTAAAAGIDFTRALDVLQKQGLEGTIKNTHLFVTEVQGAADLLLDLPAGIDVTTLALDNLRETEYGLVFDVANFNEALEEQIDLFGGLADALDSVLAEQLPRLVAGYVEIDRLAAKLHAQGGSITEIVKLVGALQEGFQDAFRQALLGAVQQQLFLEVLNSPEFVAFKDAFADALASGDFSGVNARIDEIMDYLNTVAADAAPVFAALFGDAATAQADALRDDLLATAKSLDEQVAGIRRGQGTSPQQRQGILAAISDIDRQLAGAITDSERQALLESRAQLGLDLVALAEQRYAPGARARGRAVEEGLTIVEESADLLRDFATDVELSTEATTANTASTDANTVALDANTAAHTNGIGERTVSHVEITIPEGTPLTVADIVKIVNTTVPDAIKLPAARSAVKTIMTQG